MANALFINAPLTVTQDSSIYANYIDEGNNYDYIFSINVATLCNSNMSLLFNNASYMQSTTNADLVDINITLDHSNLFAGWSTNFNNSDLTQITVGQSNIAFGTLQGNESQKLGDRFLEVVAHKLFGHGQARSAIKNDLEFYEHDSAVWDNLANAVLQSNFRHDIYNQYVALGRYSSETVSNSVSNGNNQNDVTGWVPFNFDGLTFDYPMYLTGNMLTDASLTNDERNILQNGPNVGGTLLQNGLYNIPILVKFHQ